MADAGASTGGATCDEAAAAPAARDVSGWVAAPGDARSSRRPARSAASALATVGVTTTTAQTLSADGGFDLTAMAALPACEDPVLLCSEGGAVTEVAVAP